MSIDGGFKLTKTFGSYSTLTQSNIGSNNGKCLLINQKIFFNKQKSKKETSININFNQTNSTNFIRVIKGPQMHYFSIKVLKNFFNKPFTISNTVNRMGVRLEGNITRSLKSHDIPSEGTVKGSIQIPGSGNPIVLLNDHPTIGGYPKIANVILSDIGKFSQLPIGSKFYFKEVTLKEAEKILYKDISDIKRLLRK